MVAISSFFNEYIKKMTIWVHMSHKCPIMVVFEDYKRSIPPYLDSFISLMIRFTFAANIVIAPCIRMDSIPYDSARAYPNTFFSSAFFASILYLSVRSVSLNSSVFWNASCSVW